jgi:hypothetical protein
LNYPNDELQALTLEQAGKGCVPAESQTKEMNTYIDGTPIDDARTDLSVACGVMVHIGGWYDNGYGEIPLTLFKRLINSKAILSSSDFFLKRSNKPSLYFLKCFILYILKYETYFRNKKDIFLLYHII